MTAVAEETEQTQLRPFHETIVKEIERADGEALLSLGMLIKATKIPRNHDQIIATWNKRWSKRKAAREWDYLVDELGVKDDLGVPANLLEQKQAAETQTADLASSFNFDGKVRALMIVIEKIISISSGQSRPLVEHRNENIFKLFETAKKISRAGNEQDFQAAIAEL